MTKQPPVTLRVPPEIRAAVEAFAGRNKLVKNAAYVEVLRRGLLGDLAERRMGSAKAAFEREATPFMAALAGVESGSKPIAVTVPLHKPKPFNPQPKKGKK